MDDQRSKRIIHAAIIAWIFLVTLIIALAILLAFALDRFTESIERTNLRIDRISEIEPVPHIMPPKIDYERISEEINKKITEAVAAIPKPKDGKDGKDGTDGANGKDGDTPPCLLQVGQCQGPRGLAGITQRLHEFDGKGNWRFVGDNEWQPLFEMEVATND